MSANWILMAGILGLPALASQAAEMQTARPRLPSGVAPCESCHGARGEGNPAIGVPRIAAQSAPYLARQLAAYMEGSRINPVMGPIAKNLNERLRNDLAAYYASLAAPRGAAGKPGARSERGRELATRGDQEQRLQACTSCHGPDGIGEPPTYPYIAGQHAVYLAAALKAWRDGSRNTDPTGQMSTIAKRLTDDDIAALAEYFSTVPPPGPNAFRMVRGAAKAPPLAAKPVNQGPGVAGRPGGEPQGVGIEQGEPTTGGSQGPGGGGATREPKAR